MPKGKHLFGHQRKSQKLGFLLPLPATAERLMQAQAGASNYFEHSFRRWPHRIVQTRAYFRTTTLSDPTLLLLS